MNKVEQYLIKSMYSYQEPEGGGDMWLLDDLDNGLAGIVIAYDDPLVVFRMEILDAPAPGKREELFTKLLELNAVDLVHGAYALENGKVILINSFDYDTFDYSEFQSTLDSFSLALSQHIPVIKEIIKEDSK